MSHDIYEILRDRIGESHLKKRVKRQISDAASFYSKGGYTSFHIENIKILPVVLKLLLKIFGLYKIGLENTLNYKIEHNQVFLDGLPSFFSGFTILQLSDLHTDAIKDGGKKLVRIFENLKPDVVVLTGDYRFETQDDYQKALTRTRNLIQALDPPFGFFGILGNHDFIEFVPELESMGIRMLLNEAIPIKKSGAEIWLLGVDDAHLYACHDLPKAMAGVRDNHLKILLSHTPEIYLEAEKMGVEFLLCGHTHGGQVCLPGGISIITNAKCPRKFCSGSWSYKNMIGYTSRALGASSLPVRFFCSPEITMHVLIKHDSAGND